MLHDAGPTCPASRSPPRPPRRPPPRSSPGSSSSDARPRSSPASTGPTSSTGSSPRTSPRRQLLDAAAHRARRRRGHRLLPLAQVGRADRRVPDEQGIAALPYHAGLDARVRARQPGPLPARARPGDGGDHRVRHGHRQARRALRRPPRPAEVGRGLLPGDRPRRARRPPATAWLAYGLADVVSQRKMIDDLRGRRRPPPPPRRAPRRHARALRDRRVPPRPAPRLLRAAGRALRQLRHLHEPAADLGRHRAAQKLLSAVWRLARPPASATAPATSSTSCWATHRAGHPAGPHRPDRVRHRDRAATTPSGAASSASCWPSGLLAVADGYGTLMLTEVRGGAARGTAVALRREAPRAAGRGAEEPSAAARRRSPAAAARRVRAAARAGGGDGQGGRASRRTSSSTTRRCARSRGGADGADDSPPSPASAPASWTSGDAPAGGRRRLSRLVRTRPPVRAAAARARSRTRAAPAEGAR